MTALFEMSAIGRRWAALGAWIRGQNLIQELSVLPRDETERILHDIVLSLGDTRTNASELRPDNTAPATP